LYNAAGGLESSAEIKNDDAPIGVVRLILFALGPRGGVVGVNRQLDTRPITLDTPTLLFFSSPNLVDDEGRKHGGGLAFAIGGQAG
jgi:hypothetical protein